MYFARLSVCSSVREDAASMHMSAAMQISPPNRRHSCRQVRHETMCVSRLLANTVAQSELIARRYTARRGAGKMLACMLMNRDRYALGEYGGS